MMGRGILRLLGNIDRIPMRSNMGLIDHKPESDQSIHLSGQLVGLFHHFLDFLPVRPDDFVELVVEPPEEDVLVHDSILGLGGWQQRRPIMRL